MLILIQYIKIFGFINSNAEIINDILKIGVASTLEIHNYTAMQLEFSPNDEYLASVSRDRQFVLFKKEKENSYKIFFTNKSHNRIIHSVSFSHDSKFVVTGSRDKKIKVWKLEIESLKLFAELLLPEGVNAVSFADKLCLDGYLISVGLEKGKILFAFLKENGEIKICDEIHKQISHGLDVTRIKFRKVQKNNLFQLASCGEDHTVRIYELSLNQ